MPRPKRSVQTPGAAPADTSHDADKALDAAAEGGTHKVAKHPDPETLPKSPVQGDPSRRQSATVNAKPEMTYAEAMKQMEAGKLRRSVLTEQGWLCVTHKAPKKD